MGLDGRVPRLCGSPVIRKESFEEGTIGRVEEAGQQDFVRTGVRLAQEGEEDAHCSFGQGSLQQNRVLAGR